MSSADKVIFYITGLLLRLQTSYLKPQAAITKVRQTKHHEWNLINLFFVVWLHDWVHVAIAFVKKYRNTVKQMSELCFLFDAVLKLRMNEIERCDEFTILCFLNLL